MPIYMMHIGMEQKLILSRNAFLDLKSFIPGHKKKNPQKPKKYDPSALGNLLLFVRERSSNTAS